MRGAAPMASGWSGGEWDGVEGVDATLVGAGTLLACGAGHGRRWVAGWRAAGARVDPCVGRRESAGLGMGGDRGRRCGGHAAPGDQRQDQNQLRMVGVVHRMVWVRAWCSRSRQEGPLMLMTTALCKRRSKMAAATTASPPKISPHDDRDRLVVQGHCGAVAERAGGQPQAGRASHGPARRVGAGWAPEDPHDGP
jgi:hypothetical protein